MAFNYNPTFKYTHEIVEKLSKAVSFDEKLKNCHISLADRQEISSLANIDAVHFSTKLEGNVMTHKQVTEILTSKNLNWKQERNLLEVVNYSKTRAWLFKKARENFSLNHDTVLNAHKKLLSNIVEGKLKGTYRDSQNVIKDSESGGIVYLPPESSDVKPLMSALLSWVNYAKLEGISPIVIAAIFHYQFVTIHPFLDGNGRLARVLTSSILLANNMVIPEYASLEKQHEQNRASYYSELHQLQGNNFYDIPENIDITTWISYWMDNLLVTYDAALERSNKKSKENPVYDNISIESESRLKKAVSLFKKHKQLKAIDYQTLMGLGRTQAVADLNQLVREKIIERIGAGRSSRYKIINNPSSSPHPVSSP